MEGAELELDFVGLEVDLAVVAGVGFGVFLAALSAEALGPSLSSSFLGDACFLALREDPGLETWFSAEPIGVLLPFVSALAPVPLVVVLPIEGSLALLASLALGLLVGLLVFAVSVFWGGFVSGDLVRALACVFDLRPGMAWLLRGLPELLSGEALPDVEGVVVAGWAVLLSAP